MKEIPWWVWVVAAVGGYYLYTKSTGLSAGSQVYVPSGTTLYADSGLTQIAGKTGNAIISTVGATSGSAVSVTVDGTPYWIAQTTGSAPTAAQLSASAGGTLA